mgnify:CR=1 FL=1
MPSLAGSDVRWMRAVSQLPAIEEHGVELGQLPHGDPAAAENEREAIVFTALQMTDAGTSRKAQRSGRCSCAATQTAGILRLRLSVIGCRDRATGSGRRNSPA